MTLTQTPLTDLFSLQGRTAVVTGGAGYLGQVFSEGLLEAGATVILLGRGERLAKTGMRFKEQYGNRVDWVEVDFFDSVSYRQVLHEIASRYSTVDVLVNNAFEFSKEAGFNDPSGHLDRISKDQWMRGLEAGVFWHALAIQVLGENMKEQGHGSIVNISSMYGLVSPDPNLYEGTETFNPPNYSTAKAALLGLTRYAASFYGKFGVRCNALVPGAFPNLTGASYNAQQNPEFLQRLCDRTVLERCGEPDDLKGAIVFLASDGSRYMTGQSLVIDGGWTIR